MIWFLEGGSRIVFRPAGPDEYVGMPSTEDQIELDALIAWADDEDEDSDDDL